MTDNVLSRTYYSNGKLLISGEYVVMDGAKALAVPLKFGQQMKVLSCIEDKPQIHWNTFEVGKPWFKGIFKSPGFDIITTSDNKKARWLQKLFKNLIKIKPYIFSNAAFKINCNIEFLVEWGWGSSSSLISNLAYLADVNPFELLNTISNGSGYDIACTRSFLPIIYQLKNNEREITPVYFNPEFKENLYFIYLGKKQDTSKSIAEYRETVKCSKKITDEVSEITEKMADENNIAEFKKLVNKHEIILSKLLNKQRIKDIFFPGFDGEIKSLGAWGGDFAMAVSDSGYNHVKSYFEGKDIKTIFRFNDIIKN